VIAQPIPESSAQALLHNQSQYFQPKTILFCAWCNFCEENHEERTCELITYAREISFGKIVDSTIATLDWTLGNNIMMVDTRNRSYQNKTKGNLRKNHFIPNFDVLNPQ